MPEWKPVVGFDARYAVSDEGHVKSLLTEKTLRPGVMSKGYLTVSLLDGSTPKRARSFLVHRLVAAAFLGEPPERMQVNHINGDKIDNRLANLEYVTQSENMLHAEHNGIGPKRYRGRHHANAKLTDADVAKIKAALAIDIPACAIARAFMLDPKYVCLIRDGKAWAHVPDQKVTVESVSAA